MIFKINWIKCPNVNSKDLTPLYALYVIYVIWSESAACEQRLQAGKFG